MQKLFVIGNGFDLAHGLKTAYKDFHKYLLETYFDYEFESNEEITNKELYNTSTIPEFSVDGNGENVCNDDVVLAFLGKIISDAENGNNWSDLEKSLGYLNYSGFLDDYIYAEEEDDENFERDKMFRMEYRANNISLATPQITDFFTEWISSIETEQNIAKADLKKLFDIDNDLFLTFNYTYTLEDVYNAKNVLHIHGKLGEKLWFGHGEDFNAEYYSMYYFGAEDILFDLHERLRKKTSQVAKDNMKFFKSLSEINSIYSFGFSFSNVDKVYIEEICKNLKDSDNVTWYLSSYGDNKTKSEYCDIIKSCGFNGKFDVY